MLIEGPARLVPLRYHCTPVMTGQRLGMLLFRGSLRIRGQSMSTEKELTKDSQISTVQEYSFYNFNGIF